MVTVKCTWDNASSVWIAQSEDVPGLVLESGSFDTLMERLKTAVPEMLELNGLPKTDRIRCLSESYQSVTNG